MKDVRTQENPTNPVQLDQLTLSMAEQDRICSFKSVSEQVGVLSQAVFDRYRCPQDFLDFALSGELSGDEGFFRFGPRSICYGRSSSGRRRARAHEPLDDLLHETRTSGGQVLLPFDPSDAIRNLLLERYLDSNGVRQRATQGLKSVYYFLRPFMTASARKRVQQFHARNWPKQAFPHWPVDTTVEDLGETLMLLAMRAKGVDRVPFIWFWPKGRSGCITMTHDVETEAGRDFCSSLMDLDDDFAIKSAFQVVPEKRYSVSERFLESIRRRGFEIGVQDLNHDGRLFDDREEFLRRVRRINQWGRQYGARGFRAGVLYRRPEWYDALEFSFDMSMPNVAHLDPQRGGCCSVMPYFIGDILEIPVTTVQDYTLFHLLGDYSIDLWRAQSDLILAKSGLVSMIVHPDYIAQPNAKGVYLDLLRHLSELRGSRNAWIALPSEIDQWWRARSKMSVVEDRGSYRIEGDRSGDAVLAFAKDVGGRLAYEVARAPSSA